MSKALGRKRAESIWSHFESWETFMTTSLPMTLYTPFSTYRDQCNYPMAIS